MTSTTELGQAGLSTWRAAIADRVAPPAAKRTAWSEDQIRAVLGAAFLTLALVLGEIVIARILLYTDTFPIAVVEVGRSAAGVSVALSLASLVFTWVLLLAVSFGGGLRSRKASS